MSFDKLVDDFSNDEMSDVAATSPASPAVIASVAKPQSNNLLSLVGGASNSSINTPGCFLTPQYGFTEIPTAFQMHDHIVGKRARGQYYTVTTLGAPWEQWAPLRENTDMETRPCHCSKSRIHRLMCGHVVSVPFKAEICATNCAGMQQALTQGQISRMENIAACSESVTRLAIKALLQDGGTKNSALAELMGQGYQCFEHQRQRRDLIGGEFTCAQCARVGPRHTYPAIYFAPMHVIIVIRDEMDQAIVDQISHGMEPETRKSQQRRIGRVQQRGVTRNRGDRVGRGRGNREGVKSGRVSRDLAIDKARRDEKSRVIQHLNDNAILEDMFTLGADW